MPLTEPSLLSRATRHRIPLTNSSTRGIFATPKRAKGSFLVRLLSRWAQGFGSGLPSYPKPVHYTGGIPWKLQSEYFLRVSVP